jgi:putative ABC transport system permease protein
MSDSFDASPAATGARALTFAWRSLMRQPARAALGIAGVAAVGALLFDMLLLADGLVISMRDLLEQSGFDIRVTATDLLPGTGSVVPDATTAAADIARLPSVQSVISVRFAEASVEPFDSTSADEGIARRRRRRATVQGIAGDKRPWTIVRGSDLRDARDLVINENTARALNVGPGSRLTLRASCTDEREALPPVTFRVAGVASFPFDSADAITTGTTAAGLAEACGDEQAGAANVILVTSAGDPVSTVADITERRPDLRAFTNEQAVARLEQGGFTYFRQISTVLTTVTVSFALLLITVLLTVSVNQRLGEIAALRALGFSRWRVVGDVLAESVLIVGLGGVLSLPLGFALAQGLDRILKAMPQIPAALHFFVFQPRSLWIHVGLLALTAFLAALYPMRIVARLPIAGTLRNEVVS